MPEGQFFDKGKRQFSGFERNLVARAKRNITPGERLLDYGCGTGAFLHAALAAKLDAYGVDVAASKKKEFSTRIAATNDKNERFLLYDGNILPFASDSFDYVYSWFVLEHVQDLSNGLREIARVLKPGGVALLYSQDARNSYEGHAKIPWPPFLPKKYIETYLEEWNAGVNPDIPKAFLESGSLTEYLVRDCFYITSDQVRNILECFGMKVFFASVPDGKPYYKEFLRIYSAEDARAAAQYFKKRYTNKEWEMPKEQLRIYARKEG